MYTIETNYPGPPVDAVLPAGPHEVILWITLAVLAACLLIALKVSLREKTALPVLFLLAGFCTIPLESLVCHLGHAWHPVIGQNTLYTSYGVSVPVYIALIYSFYFGGAYLAMYSRLQGKQPFTAAWVWKAYFVTCALAYLIEVVPLQLGMWIYYDKQALWLWHGGMPLFWTFVNAACIFGGLTLIRFFMPVLRGWKQILVVLLSPVGVIMVHLGTGFPFYMATNSDASQSMVELGGAVSVALALLMVAACTRVLTGHAAMGAADIRQANAAGASFAGGRTG